MYRGITNIHVSTLHQNGHFCGKLVFLTKKFTKCLQNKLVYSISRMKSKDAINLDHFNIVFDFIFHAQLAPRLQKYFHAQLS